MRTGTVPAPLKSVEKLMVSGGEGISGLQSPRLRGFQNSGAARSHPARLSVYSPGGGLHASGGYQQEAGSSVLFEHCSADSALAVENVDELMWWIRTRWLKMHVVRVHRRSYLHRVEAM